MDQLKRVRARVSGVVQGVSYRASAQEKARALGVVGWVKNERDGAVLLEAQGRPEAVDALIAWCEQGPPLADVDEVDVTAIASVDGEARFEIRR